MINIVFINHGQETFIKGFKISGHSGYANKGSDIICSAISSCAYMVINTITDIYNIKCEIKIDDNKPDLYLQIINDFDLTKCSKILKGLEIHFLNLSKMYPKNILVSYMEV